MSITLAIPGRPPVRVTEESITLGSDANSGVSFPDAPGVLPRHAVIRKIAGRWLVEVRDAESVFVDGPEPKRLFWLTSGDRIQLTENGPEIVFDPVDSEPLPGSTVPRSEPGPVAGVPGKRMEPVILPPDSSPSLPVLKPPPLHPSKPPKPPSSATIPTRKSPSSGSIKTTKPQSSGTIRVNSPDGTPKRKSSAQMPTVGGRKSGTIRTRPDDEPPADAPVLERMTSSWDDPFERSSLTSEQAEIRWILKVVGYSFAVGAIVLVAWTTISWVMDSMKPMPVSQSY